MPVRVKRGGARECAFGRRGATRLGAVGPRESAYLEADWPAGHAESGGVECYWAGCHAVGFPVGAARDGRARLACRRLLLLG